MRPVVFLSLAFFYQGVLSQLVCRDGQLRLGSNNQLWACRSGQWGIVCSNDFELNDAVVACRNLGYGVEESEVSYSTVNGVSDFVALSSLDCDGSEDYLWDCVHSYTECQMSGGVSLNCPSSSCVHGELRLVNGFSSTEGTLEICKNGLWNTICKDGFGGQEAYVACRQMGLSASNAEVTDTAFSTGHGWAEYTEFLCTGEESSLTECNYSLSSSCLSFDSYTGLVSVAQLRCLGDPAPETCSGSGIRINNNEEILSKGSGRLELCQSGAWGTVNNNMFGVKDSLVACRQLGVPAPSTQVYPQGYFANNAAGPIILRDLMCVGSEQSLYSAADPPPGCSNGESTVDLDHSTDVFLNCWTKVGVSCNNGDVRLTNGSNKDEGRVEVCFGEEWGTFCDNFWDRREARVICNQLGYPNSYGAFYTESKFGTGDQIPYIYTDMNCSGTENGIVSCQLSDQIEGEKCLYGRAVGVKCYNNTGCTDGMVRLVGGSETDGDVQVCRNGVWGYICDEEWTESEAHVVCHDQGFSDAWYGRSTSSLFGGSQDDAPIVYDSVDCVGSENKLSDCTKSEYASLYPMCLNVAGVTCLRIDECENGQVRLDGGTSSEGRVEICAQGLWTTVKSNEIAYEDAQVICKQLGFDAEWSVVTLGNTWGTGDRMIYYDGINCDGSESTIIECAKTTISINTDANEWYSYERAGVSCENRQLAESCTDQGAIRLKEGTAGQNGRLEICLNNYWGSVCNKGWTQNNGLVACRQAGFETLRPLLSSAVFSERMNGPVNAYNVNCNGHESKLTDCEWSNAVGESSCYHEEDVGLDCKATPDVYSFITISSNKEEPFPIGTSVTLICEGAPATDDIMYSWSRDEIDMDVNTSSLTFTVGANFRQSFNVYCKVNRINEKVGVGMRKCSVQGALTANEGVVIAVPGQDITLSFNRQDTHINDYLLEPAWTFQGNDIDATQPRYTVSSDGLSLTITNVALADYGIYSLQYNGLNLQAHNEFCEQTTLSLLRDYPVFSTGYIILTPSDTLPDVEDSNHLLDQDYDIHNFTFGETLLRLTAGRSGAIPSEQQLQPEWYFNGAQYLSSPELLLRDHSPFYDFILQYPVLFDSGFYELVLKFPFVDLMTSLGCSREYGSRYLEFLQTEEFMGFNNNYFIVDTAVIEVQYNEMPTAQLTTDKSSFVFSDDAVIRCDGSGGYPRYFNIELWKGDTLLANTSGQPPYLDFNTANISYGSQYGSYRCIVDNTLLTDTTSITVSNQELISVMFRSGGCNNWNSSDVSAIEQAVLDRFDQTCSCKDDATLINSVLSCPLGESIATFNTTLVYTNTDGTMLARDIVNSTLKEFNDRINRTFVISGTSYSISNGPPDPEDSFELSEGAILALMFIGGFLAATLISVAVIIVVVFKLRRRSDTAARQSDVLFHNQGGNSKVNITEDDINYDDFHPPPEEI